MEYQLNFQNFKSCDNLGFVKLSDKFKTKSSISINPICNLKTIDEFRLYRYVQFHHLYSNLNKDSIVFISPKKWDDPFEKKLLLIDNIFCICTTSNYSTNEEASWARCSINAKSPIVRVSLKFLELLKLLNRLGQANNILFYIGVVDYSFDRKTISSIAAYYKKIKNSLTINQVISLMCLKRSSFSYEDEIRIFAIPQNTKTISSDDLLKLSLKKINQKLNSIIGSVVLPPLRPIDGINDTMFEQIQKVINGGMEDFLNHSLSNQRYIKSPMTKRVINSGLYRD